MYVGVIFVTVCCWDGWQRGWKPEDTIERIIEEQREHMESSELEQFNSPPAMPPPRAPPPSFSSTTQSARSDVSEDRATAPSQSAMQQARQRSASSQMQSPASFKGSAEREPADAISGEEDAGEEGKDRRSRPLTSGDNQPAPRPQTEVPVQRRGRTGAGIALCLAARSGKLDGVSPCPCLPSRFSRDLSQPVPSYSAPILSVLCVLARTAASVPQG